MGVNREVDLYNKAIYNPAIQRKEKLNQKSSASYRRA